ncbi:DUF3164 family protein [Achromobacter insolitus]|uniref:DUF3164 family protein n=1 Tax=Achromobacter insolitus TaxID=217204 RepID=UPI001EED0749|nr:DUF3164 family protein [Achromobacter insolitus]
MSITTVPDGYKRDPHGRLVPVSAIRAIDLERDDLVQKIVARGRKVSADLTEFKADTFGDIQAFVELSAEQYGAKVGGKKGNVSLLSFDGRYKVSRAINDNIVFDERLQAAKALIDQCLVSWTENASPEIRAIVDRAFEVDKAGDVNIGRVLALRRVEINDPRWKEAMRAIGESIQVVGSRSYVRLYERIGDTDQYKQIPLDIAGA